MPVSTIPMVRSPQINAADENIISTEGTYLSASFLSKRLVTTSPVLPLLKERCCPPGTINISPVFITSSFAASFTLILHILFNLSANGLVNPGGICCDTTTQTGNPSGRRGSIWESAGGPPVDEPMAITSNPLMGTSSPIEAFGDKFLASASISSKEIG